MKVEIPYDEIAERAVLGGLIAEPSLTIKAIDMGLKEEDFYEKRHRQLYALLLKLFAEFGTQWDDITAITFAEKHGINLDRNFLYMLVEEAALGTLFETALLRIKELSNLRKAKDIALSILNTNDLKNIETNIAKLENLLRPSTNKTFTVYEVVKEVYENLNALRKKEKLITGIESGFLDLDLFTTGFYSGHMVVIGARPGMGKSSFMLSMALAMAKKGTKVGIFSLEMTRQELIQRIIAIETGIMLRKIRTGQITEEEWNQITEAMLELKRFNLWINDTAKLSPLDLRIELRKHPADVVFVDYLQLIRSSEKYLSRQEEVAHISQSLKAIAKDFNLCVIALAQLNRQVEQRANKRPTLADLRESGAIEQDADIVLLLHRPEYYKKEPDKQGLTEIIIAKNRHGATGTVYALFQKETTAFLPISTPLEKIDLSDTEELDF